MAVMTIFMTAVYMCACVQFVCVWACVWENFYSDVSVESEMPSKLIIEIKVYV